VAAAAAEPVREPPPAEAPSNEELISQLRGSTAPAAEKVIPPEPPPASSGSDLGAARLVAMNMALDGASRAQITAQITTEFSAVGNVEILVDDVIRRASR
jgi:hypothetical protein